MKNEASVIGLGTMGVTLARLLLRACYRVTVWNRTSAKARPFAVSESPLKISVEATARLAQLARESGINAEFPTFVSGFFQRAHAAGFGDEGFAALIKVLR